MSRSKEVLFSLDDPETPLAWLQRPVLTADAALPYESGYSVSQPPARVSHWRDTIFFTGLTRHEERYLVYYGGSEYYTCLASVAAHAGGEPAG